MKKLSETNWEDIVAKNGKFLGPESESEVPMRKHPKTGEMVADPFAANAEALKRGKIDAPAERPKPKFDPFAKHHADLRKGIVHEDDTEEEMSEDRDVPNERNDKVMNGDDWESMKGNFDRNTGDPRANRKASQDTEMEEAVRVMGQTRSDDVLKRLEKNKHNPNAQKHRDDTAALVKQARANGKGDDLKQNQKEVGVDGKTVMRYQSQPRLQREEMEESTILEKKWIKTDPDKKGMFKGKTKAELVAQRDKLKVKHAKQKGDVSEADKVKMAELNFAIRAKSKGGLKESLIKNLRTLLETEVSQAEVMMAAKGFAQEIQEMIEKIGRLQNEDLPPVTDQMRETYGTNNASVFQTEIYAALQTIMNSLYTAKGQIDDAVENLATTGQISASVDMDKEVDLDEPVDDLDGVGEDELDNTEDEFGAEETEEPLGRVRKESIQLQQKVLEMKRLVEKARRLKESDSEDRLDELSPATLGSYGRKAKGEARWANGVAGALKDRGSDGAAKPYADLAKKRREGAANAEKKSGVKQSPEDYESYDWQNKGGYGDKSNPATKK